MATRTGWLRAEGLALVVIMAVASTVRFWQLDAASFWFDEVVTMRVARAGRPGAVLEQLQRLDGTRAPLHPLLLSGWMRVFGASEAGGRSLSAVCGVLTVWVIYRLGRSAYDRQTGLWSAWLASVCPPLVYYSREARMYSWLLLLTSVSWLVFLSFRGHAGWRRRGFYAVLLTALAYSHPVGLFMIVAHGLAFLVVRKRLTLGLRQWAMLQVAVLLAILPWVGQYLNRGTDYPLPRYGISFLLAVPIEYVGGNKWVLAVCVAVIVHGLARRSDAPRRGMSITHPLESITLLIWAATPPVLMYAYSYLARPIFGPPRYHLFIAPAYLILLALGLVKLPAVVRWGLALIALCLSLSVIRVGVYAQPLKADWRGAANWLDQQRTNLARKPEMNPIILVVHPSDPRFPREELEAARYYLQGTCRVVAADDRSPLDHDDPVYDAVCQSSAEVIPETGENSRAFVGLVLTKRLNH